MTGLNTCTRLRAIMARRRRRINSSLLPENMGPQTTSIHPTLPVRISISLRGSLSENQNVLPWKHVQRLIQPVSLRFDLRLHFLHAHFVFRANGDSGIFLAVFEQHQAAVSFERLVDALQ